MAFNRPLTVKWSAERINDATKQSRSNRDTDDIPGPTHAVARLDAVDIVEQNTAHPIGFEHLRKTELTLLETEQFVQPDIGQP